MTHVPGIQDVINVGATPNDGTGDPLRDAMVKVNDNFKDLFSNAVVNTNITVGNNSVNVFANSTTIFTGNVTTGSGGLKVNSSVVLVGNNTVNTSINSTSITINANNGLRLGSNTNAANGYTYLPNNFKLNWGWVSANSTAGNVTFSSAYTTNVYVVTATSNSTVATYQAAVIGTNNTVAVIRTANATSTNVFWHAIGY